jgi:uncharacterized repeat protein (TIGR01451 family)
MIGPGAVCTIIVNVTSATAGEGPYTNTTGNLTSGAGNSGGATADLLVDDDLPGFSKGFSPSTVAFGGRSTLTFTIDNTTACGECASDIQTLSFIDTLPTSMVVAAPANASTDCQNPPAVPATLTATPGTSLISLLVVGGPGFPALAAEDTCTVTVDVIGGAVGRLGNVTSDLLVVPAGSVSQVAVGKAAAVLEVTGVTAPLELTKEFTDDPVAPGGTVTLEFTVTNRSRADSATGITFSDDLAATLTGLSPTLPPTPDPPCGAASALAFGMGVLTLTGGSLAPEASCTFSVELGVPAGTVPGTYPNTAGPVSGDVGGSPETGNVAGDLLFVVSFPVLSKEFTDDPVGAGGTVTLEFTISNPEATSTMSDITFIDELTDATDSMGNPTGGFLPFPVSVNLPPTPDPPCGPSSSLGLVSLGTERQGLALTGGSLAAAGQMGDSCTFSVTVDIPAGFESGTYRNTTEEISGVLDDFPGPPTVFGPPASDDIVIVGAPQLGKEFTDDPAVPGGTVTLQLTLENLDIDNAASAIAFSDDLGATLPGLTLTSELGNTCGGTVGGIGTGMFDYTGGALASGASCTITLSLTLPPAPLPGAVFPNTTSEVTATVAGIATESPAASDDLVATGLRFSKEFTDDPVIAGGTATLVFTLDNTTATQDAVGVGFTDDLDANLPGLTPTLPPVPDPPCGVGSSLTESVPRTLSFTNGSVPAGTSCSFSVTVTVPPGTPDDAYANITSPLSAIIEPLPPDPAAPSPAPRTGGVLVTLPPATDHLVVQSDILALSKEFTDDPVEPGDTVTLAFTLENLNATETVTDISFDDDLDAALGGLMAVSATTNTCGGMAASMFPTGLFEYAGGSLLPGATCMIVLAVDVPGVPLASGPPYVNTTTGVTGKVGALDVFGDAASDELEVDLLTLSKSFDGPTTATGSAVLSFTITNVDPDSGVTGLAFSDDLEAVISGLVATLPPTPNPPCGAGSVLAGSSFLAFSGGSLPAGGDCSFEVVVNVPAAAADGTFVNTTSNLFASGVPVAEPATALLTIEPPPAFSKAFAPSEITVGGVSTLTFTIDNTGSALAATALDFSDTLPAPMVVATPPNASTTCTGGTLTAVAGGGNVSYSGGSVAAGASCTVQVDVTADLAGLYANVSGDLTSSSGNSGSASAELQVVVADLQVGKTDLVEPVMAGGYQIYQLTVTNLGPGAAASTVLTDALPAGVTFVLAEPVASCGEAAAIVTCALGDLPSGASATVTIQVYVEPTETPVPIDNMAMVTSDTVDPQLDNNSVMETTEVIPLAGVAALADVDGSGFPEVAVPLAGTIEVLVKDVETLTALHQTEVFPDGWALAGFARKPGIAGAKDDLAVMAIDSATGAGEVRVVAGLDGALVSTAKVPAGYQAIGLSVIADDGGSRTLLVVAARRLGDGRFFLFLFDAADGSLAGFQSQHPAAWVIATAPVSSFAGDALVELASLWVNRVAGGSRIRIRQLDGTLVNTQVVPGALKPFALAPVTNCCGMAADELATLGWNSQLDRVQGRTTDADGGGLVSNATFAAAAAPAALRSMANFAGTAADELAGLYRSTFGRAGLRVRDADTGAQLLVGGFGPVSGSVPLGLAIAASAYDTVADELAVYWVDPLSGTRFVTLRDAGSGADVASVPIP